MHKGRLSQLVLFSYMNFYNSMLVTTALAFQNCSVLPVIQQHPFVEK